MNYIFITDNIFLKCTSSESLWGHFQDQVSDWSQITHVHPEDAQEGIYSLYLNLPTKYLLSCFESSHLKE